jgi:gliding motility-associated-like protein
MQRILNKITRLFLLAFSLATFVNVNSLYAQCNSLTPTYNVDLSAGATSSKSILNVTGAGSCCSNPSLLGNVRFNVTLNSAATGIWLEITSGTIPSTREIRVNCGGTVYDINQYIPLTGTGPHVITYSGDVSLLNNFRIYSQVMTSAVSGIGYDLKLFPFIQGDSLYVDVVARNTGSTPFVFGNSNFVFEINPAGAIDMPNKQRRIVQDGPWDNNIDPTHYDDMSLGPDVSPLDTQFVNLTIRQNIVADSGLIVPGTDTRIGRIAFRILDCSRMVTLSWRTTGFGSGDITNWNNNSIKDRANFIDPGSISLKIPVGSPTLTTGPITPTSIQYNWTAITGATAYQVSTNNGSTWIIPSSGTTGLFHLRNGIAPGACDSLLVRALSTCDTSSAVQGSACTPTVCNPLTEAPILGANTDPEKIIFVWSSVFGATGYQISRDGVNWGDNGTGNGALLPATTLTFAVTGLTYPDCDSLIVRAINACDTIYSNKRVACIPFNTGCILYARSNDTTVCVGQNFDICLRDVRRFDNLPFTPQVVWGSNSSASRDTCTNYTVSVAGPQVLTFTVYDSLSPTCFATGTFGITGIPLLGTSAFGLGVTFADATSITWTWNPVANALFYEVSTDNGATWFAPNGTTSHTISGLTHETCISLRVRAVGRCNTRVNTTNVQGCTDIDGCFIGYVVQNNYVDVCKDDTLVFTISNISVYSPALEPNYEVSFNNEAFQLNLSTYTYTVPLQLFVQRIPFEIRNPNDPTCFIRDTIVVQSKDLGDPTWYVYQDTFCIADVAEWLNNPVLLNDPGGFFTGNGLVTIGNNVYFYPPAAGPGTHPISYHVCGAVETKLFTVLSAPCEATVIDDTLRSGPTGQPYPLAGPEGVFTTCDGTIYFTDYALNSIYKMDTLGFVTRIVGAGNGSAGFADGFAGAALLSGPAGIVVDETTGRIYWAEQFNHRVRMYDPTTFSVSTLVGANSGNVPANGVATTVPAANARFNNPFGLAFSTDKTKLYISDQNNFKIREFDITANTVRTISGSGNSGIIDSTGIISRYQRLYHLSADDNFLYIAENSGIRRLELSTTRVRSLARNNSGHDDGFFPPTIPTAGMSDGRGVAAVGSNFVYFTDYNNHAVKKVDNRRYMEHVSGSPPPTSIDGDITYYTEDLFDARYKFPSAMFFTPRRGFLDLADNGNGAIRRIALGGWELGPFENIDSVFCQGSEGDTLRPLFEGGTYSLVYTSNGSTNILLNDSIINPVDTGTYVIGYSLSSQFCSQLLTFTIRVLPLPVLNLVDTVNVCADSVLINAGTGPYTYLWSTGSTDSITYVNTPGYVYLTITDTLAGCTASDSVFVQIGVPPTVTISASATTICWGDSVTLTANGVGGFSPYSYQWNTLDTSQSITIYAGGVFIVDLFTSDGCTNSDTIIISMNTLPSVCITTTPDLGWGSYIVETVAGSTSNSSGTTDNVIGTNARFNQPWDLLVHRGYLYITELNRIRRMRLSDNFIETFAGSNTSFIPDSIGRLNARFNSPKGIVADRFGNFYVNSNSYISKIDILKDSVFVIAGDPMGGTGSTDSTGRESLFDDPKDLAIVRGNLFVADFNNHKIRRVNLRDNRVSTFAGTGTQGVFSSDRLSSTFNWPWGIVADFRGNLLIAEDGGHLIRRINLLTGNVSAVIGQDGISGTSGTPGYVSNVQQQVIAGATARLNRPWNMTVSKVNNVYLTDANNHSIRCFDKDYNILKIAGRVSGTSGVLGGVDGSADTASFNAPVGIAIDNNTGRIYIADRTNHKIRRITKVKTINFCQGDSILIDATCSGNNLDYSWTEANTSILISNTASIYVSSSGVYVVSITDNITGCSNNDTVYVNVAPAPLITVTNDTTICSSETIDLEVINSNPTANDSIAWTLGGTLLSNNSILAGVSIGGTYVVSITNTVTGCSDIDSVIVTVNDVTTALAGNDTTVCGTAHVLNGNVAVFGTGLWTTTTAGTVIDNPTSNNTTVTLVSGANEFIWTITNGTCISSDTIIVTSVETPLLTVTNDTTICNGESVDLEVTITNAIGGELIEWTDATATVLSNTNTLTGITTAGTYYVSVENSAGCITTDSVIVTVNDVTTALAGNDTTVCGTAHVLNGNVAVFGTGLWTTTTAGTVIDNPTSNNTTVTLVTGANEFIWTITNGTCISSDTIIVTSVETPLLTVTNDTTICNGESVDLEVTITNAIGGELIEWTDATATVLSNTNTLTGITTAGTYYVSVENSAGCITTDSVIVTVNDVTTALAGNDTTVCGTAHVLNGNVAVFGTGLWTTTTAGTVIDNPTSNNTTVTLVTGANEFIWTITNGTCISSDTIIVTSVETPLLTVTNDTTICNGESVDLEVTITNAIGGELIEWTDATATVLSNTNTLTGITTAGTYYVSVENSAGCITTDSVIVTVNDVTTALAGNDTTVCGTAHVLNGNVAVFGTGLWTTTTAGTVIDNPTSNNTTVTLVTGANEFIWTITNGTCISSDTIIVTSVETPLLTVTNDTTICNGESVDLEVTITNAIGGELIEWTDATATVLSNTNTLTGITTAGTYYVSVENSAGCITTDSVIVTVNDVTTALAGNDTTVCGTAHVLNGNVAVFGTGLWTTTTAGTVIDNPTSNNTTVTLVTGANEFIWTITNGTCISSDTIIVTSVEEPLLTVTNDTTICNGESVDLEVTITNAIGGELIEWTDATATVLSNTNTLTGITTAGTYYVSVENSAGCITTDSVIVTVNDVTTALAGNDTTVCGTAHTLNGNVAVFGTGLWTTTTAGTVIDNPTSNNTTVTLVTGANEFIWTITNGTCISSDTIIVTSVETPLLTVTNDTTICNGESVDLEVTITNAIGGELIEWTDATATVLSNTNTLTGITTAGTYYVSVENSAGCITTDSVIVTVNDVTTALAGNDTTVCGTAHVLNGNVAVFGTGLWTTTTAGTVIDNPTSNNTTVTLVTGANEFIWTITNGICFSSDTILITSIEQPFADAGADTTLCGVDNIDLYANNPTVGSGLWTVISGTASFADNTDPNTNVNGFTAGNNTLVWTVTNGICVDSDTIVINYVPNFDVADAGIDSTICGTSITLYANTPSVGTGVWTGGTVTPNNDPNGVATLVTGVNQFIWTISNGTCISSDTVEITSLEQPVITVSNDTTICTGEDVLLSVTVVSGTASIITWTDASNNIISNTSTVTVSTAGMYYVEVSNGSCSSIDSVNVNVLPLPTVAFAGNDTTLCEVSLVLNANSPLGTETGTWTSGTVIPANNPNGTANLNPGTNILIWTISNGVCASSDTVIVNRSVLSQAANAGADQTLCNGATSGTLTAGALNAGVTGLWTTNNAAVVIANPTSASTTISNLPLGSTTFYWTITEGTCTETDSVVIQVNPSNVSIVALGNTTFCQGQSVTLQATSIPGALYQWFNGTTPVTSQTANDSLFVVTQQGSYSVVITDGACVINSNNIAVIVNELPVISLPATSAACLGATVTLDAGNAGFIFSWLNSVGTLVGNSQTFTTGTAGIYSVIVTNPSTSCSNSAVTTVFIDTPVIVNAGADDTTCRNVPIQLIGQVNSSDALLQWTTSGLGTFSNDSIINPMFRPGNYDFDEIFVILEANSPNFACPTAYDTLIVLVKPTPIADFTPSVTATFLEKGPIIFTNNSLFGTNYLWTFGDGNVDSTSFEPSHQYGGPRIYNVTLIVSNNEGCSDTARARVEIISNQILYIPNMFTPFTSPGKNDILYVRGTNISERDFLFRIYNRWGELIFETSNLEYGWDGTKMGTGEQMPLGAYTYSAVGKFRNGEVFEKVGTVTLVK